MLVAAPALAQQAVLPTGGSVAAGGVAIVQPNATTLNINQSTNQAIINWNTFSVGRGDTVNFNQPGASSSTLNRVTSSTPSWIAGVINALGTVILINPNGIEITKSGVINTGSFAASTLNIKDSDFLSGNYTFTGNGGSAGVINGGRINVSDGGFAALLGGQVSNNGIISARLGEVALGAGELITLDLSGDGFLSVAVPSSQLGNLVNANGALVSNNGKINANGGTVFLSAATASNILRDAVNMGGSVRANSVGVHNGRIVINGGSGGAVNITGRIAANGSRKNNGGSIAVSGASITSTGKITADGRNGGSVSMTSSGDLWVSGTIAVEGLLGNGGDVALSGSNISLSDATIDASGATGGGLALIGGTFQGGNGDPTSALYQEFIGQFGTLPDITPAQTVSVDAATKINVSALNNGNAGTAIIWSEEETDFAGTVIGAGGPNGGNGGYAEVSSHDILNFTGTVNLLAPGGGTAGTLLLDPYTVTIASGTGGTITGGSFTATANSTIGATTLDTALGSSNVIISTGTTTTGTAGSIVLNSGVTLNWSSGNTLTLDSTNATSGTDAPGTITLTGSVTPSSGSLILEAGGSISTGNITVSSLSISTNGTVSQGTGTSITATNLQLLGTGPTYTLTKTNSVGTLAASVGTGTVSLTDSGNLAIGSVTANGTTNGVTAGTLSLSFSSAKGVTTESQAINVTSMSLSGSGAGTDTLTNASNSIGTFAASVGNSGTISLTDSSSTLAIGSVNSINGVTAGTLTLTETGAVTQSQNLTVTNLALLGTGGSYTLTNSNSVGTLAANTGTVSLTDGSALTIGTAGGTTGVNLSGTLTLNVNGTISDPTAAVSVNAFILDGGNWSQVGTLPTFTATADFELNGGSFLRATSGSGSSTSPYTLVDVYGLQGVTTLYAFNNFDLAGNINASGTATWNPCGTGCYAGFVPIGGGTYQGGSTIFQSATFDGKGFSITGLYINLPNTNNVGLFGYLGTTVQNVSLVNANITGEGSVGALVGTADGSASIFNSSATGATGTVTGTSSDVGGLVGANFGPISGSSAAVTVNGGTGSNNVYSYFVGGLAGYSDGTITNSYATGPVTGFQYVGGLIGGSDAPVSNAYATGNVTGGSGEGYIGGLIGTNSSSVSQTYYATGTVTETIPTGLHPSSETRLIR